MSAPERSRRARASEFASGLSFGFLDEAPELKSLGIDCLFDRIAGEVIGRSAVRPDRARGGPGTMVLRESAAREVAREGPQILPRFRLENVDPHGLTLSTIGGKRVGGGPKSRSSPDRMSLCGRAHKPWLPSCRSGPDLHRRREAIPPHRTACRAEPVSAHPR